MSENENKLAKQLKRNQKAKAEPALDLPKEPVELEATPDAPTPALVALFKDPENRTPEDHAALDELDALELEGGAFAYTPDVPDVRAPFTAGTWLAYAGTRRLFAGWYGIPVLEPGIRVVITDVADVYSMYTVDVQGRDYRFAISPDGAHEWLVVERTPEQEA